MDLDLREAERDFAKAPGVGAARLKFVHALERAGRLSEAAKIAAAGVRLDRADIALRKAVGETNPLAYTGLVGCAGYFSELPMDIQDIFASRTNSWLFLYEHDVEPLFFEPDMFGLKSVKEVVFVGRELYLFCRQEDDLRKAAVVTPEGAVKPFRKEYGRPVALHNKNSLGYIRQVNASQYGLTGPGIEVFSNPNRNIIASCKDRIITQGLEGNGSIYGMNPETSEEREIIAGIPGGDIITEGGVVNAKRLYWRLIDGILSHDSVIYMKEGSDEPISQHLFMDSTMHMRGITIPSTSRALTEDGVDSPNDLLVGYTNTRFTDNLYASVLCQVPITIIEGLKALYRNSPSIGEWQGE